jgi:hypothetical protein
MLCPDLRDVRVYLHRAPVDMRRYAPTKNMRSAWVAHAHFRGDRFV